MTEYSNGNPFSASASLVGYLYQCRYALLECLKRLRRSDDFIVTLETLDDVVFEEDGSTIQLLQTKHHLKSAANLTDASPDLWKTLRIWSEGLLGGSIPTGSSFFLVTTSIAPTGAAAFYLKLGETRDAEKAAQRLNSTVDSSTNTTNEPAYAAYRKLNQEQRLSLASSVMILDGSPSILGLDSCLKEEAFFAAPRQYLDSFLQRLEGWWLQRAIRHLAEDGPQPILSEEIDSEFCRLREQFKQDNLPVDDDIMQASIDATGYEDMAFVQQLRLIEVGNPRILHAVRNYFRAFEHRSRWVREDLLLVGELDRYESKLTEEWDILFQQMRDELGEKASEAAKKSAAQTLYKWVETGTHHPIRAGVTEPAIARGSYQILSDQVKIGWHLEYAERLRESLEPREVES